MSVSRTTVILAIVGVISCLLLLRASKNAETVEQYTIKYPSKWFPALSTMYTGSLGAAGVSLDKYPLTAFVSQKFGTRTLYPVALHTNDVAAWKYKVLEIRFKNRRIFGHVVDECAAGDCHENLGKAKRKKAKLIDIHQTAWKPLGLKKMDTLSMKARVVGYLSPRGSGRRAMSKVLTKDGAKGYVPSNWKA